MSQVKNNYDRYSLLKIQKSFIKSQKRQAQQATVKILIISLTAFLWIGKLIISTAISVLIAGVLLYGYMASDFCQNREAIWLVRSEIEPSAIEFEYKAKALEDNKSVIYCYRPENLKKPVNSFLVDTKELEIGALKK